MQANTRWLTVLSAALLVTASIGSTGREARAQQGPGTSLGAGTAMAPSSVPRLGDGRARLGTSAVQAVPENVPPRGFEVDPDLVKGQAPPPGPQPQATEDASVVADEVSPLYAPELNVNFQGIQDTGSFPPDPIIAAGPTHVIQAVNRSWRATDKSGTNLFTTTFASWWAPVITGVSPFDPWVHYDHHANRFVLLTVARDTTNNQAWYLIATSHTNSATGNWCVWALDADVDGSTPSTNWADYPKLGLDNTNFYITSNQFSFVGAGSFQYSKVRLMNKTQFYNNTCGAIGWWDWWGSATRNADGTQAFTMQPALTFGAPGAEYLVNSRSGSGTNVTLWTATGTWPNATGAAPVLTRVATVGVGSYSAPPNAEQSGSATRINTMDARLINAVYQSGSLYTTHTVGCNAGANACARYLRIGVAGPTVTLDETLGASGSYYFYPSVMPDASGNIVTVFHRSSASEFAHVRYTSRRTTDSAFQSSATLKAGEASYVEIDSFGRNRWGDYSGIARDPSDTKMIWIYGEYAESPANTWGTWVGRVDATTSVSTCGVVGFASRAPSVIGSLPALTWLVLPLLVVAGWRLGLRRGRGASEDGAPKG